MKLYNPLKKQCNALKAILPALLIFCLAGCSAQTPDSISAPTGSPAYSSVADQTTASDETQSAKSDEVQSPSSDETGALTTDDTGDATADDSQSPSADETGSAAAEESQSPAAEESQSPANDDSADDTDIDLADIPDFSGEPYVVINDNVPEFTEADMTESSFEEYSKMDSLGRCGVAYACIGTDLMPTEERESIGKVKPSGWHTVKYNCVDGKYLYNRCHLIGYQLTAENANKRNLITGTRYMNVDGMLPFENMVADYIKETGNHVLYRVTPIFEGDNLVANGVQMEAESVEDNGDGISYNVYCYNEQPGVSIDHETGDSEASGKSDETGSSGSPKSNYILNINTHKFHYPDCPGVKRMKDENKQKFKGSRADAISKGYEPCGICNP